ncbi:MAG: zinc ribbon domain-containing protein [Chloroflexota bacterium]|nr:zinc ribbon domain-containing protein [Chloroflexota bacterium]MDE3194389.1 zinc ribbon domain-containing protein [Chloroflexota bacterium]
MPIYEYRCDACGLPFDQLRPMGASDTATCPACGSVDARRLVSRVASVGGDCGSGGGFT